MGKRTAPSSSPAHHPDHRYFLSQRLVTDKSERELLFLGLLLQAIWHAVASSTPHGATGFDSSQSHFKGQNWQMVSRNPTRVTNSVTKNHNTFVLPVQGSRFDLPPPLRPRLAAGCPDFLQSSLGDKHKWYLRPEKVQISFPQKKQRWLSGNQHEGSSQVTYIGISMIIVLHLQGTHGWRGVRSPPQTGSEAAISRTEYDVTRT